MKKQSTAWRIAFVDMLLCIVGMFALINVLALISMHPPKKDEAGVAMRAEYVITAEWASDVDADVDLWVHDPVTDKMVFYNDREAGLIHLDRDSQGFVNNKITVNGKEIISISNKEIATVRGAATGKYDVGVHLYTYKKDGVFVQSGGHPDQPVRVHVEVVRLNPNVEVVASKDVLLDTVFGGENVVSFDVDANKRYKEIPTPVEPIMYSYYRATGSGGHIP